MGSHTNRPPAGSPPDEETADFRAVFDGIRRIVHELRLFDRTTQQRVGLSGAQMFVLQRLATVPAASLNELAQSTHTHQSSVSVVVQKLADRKLVARAASPEDGRRLELSVTPRGRALLHQAPEAAQERLGQGLRRLGARDRAALGKLLAKLAGAMGASVSEGAPAMFFEDGERNRRAAGAAPDVQARAKPIRKQSSKKRTEKLHHE